MRCASPPERVGAERSSARYPKPTRSRNCNRARISASRSWAIAASRAVNLSCVKNLRTASIDSQASAAIERSRKRTLSATGFNRAPAQALHSGGAPSYHSFHQISSPVCSALKPLICKPVPKQLSHQPCFELKEKSRGSSCAKPLPQEGHARRVEHTSTRAPFAPRTCATPLPKSSVRSSAACSSASFDALTSRLATGSSIVCSRKRDRRRQPAVATFAPSTRSHLNPFLAAHFAR